MSGLRAFGYEVEFKGIRVAFTRVLVFPSVVEPHHNHTRSPSPKSEVRKWKSEVGSGSPEVRSPEVQRTLTWVPFSEASSRAKRSEERSERARAVPPSEAKRGAKRAGPRRPAERRPACLSAYHLKKKNTPENAFFFEFFF